MESYSMEYWNFFRTLWNITTFLPEPSGMEWDRPLHNTTPGYILLYKINKRQSEVSVGQWITWTTSNKDLGGTQKRGSSRRSDQNVQIVSQRTLKIGSSGQILRTDPPVIIIIIFISSIKTIEPVFPFFLVLCVLIVTHSSVKIHTHF